MATKSTDYPRHSLEKALRFPNAILEQNAGKSCTDKEAASFCGIKYNAGPIASEIGSSIKYGLLTRPETGKLELSEVAKKILRPQSQNDKIDGYRKAFLSAPGLSDVYMHYRGENLPDDEFFNNALTEKFKIPINKVDEFKSIFLDGVTIAELVSEKDGKKRLLDISDHNGEQHEQIDKNIKKLEKETKISKSDNCFVMMPFAEPIGSYYEKIYKPAIEKAGLLAIRADDEIFGTGKIIDQIWQGINSAKVLIAELTSRNANVFYELGIAHSLKKPVVLISSNEKDVPFDLHHIRVIYYDMTDPFWGQKLIDKIAENILNAIKNPNETIVFKD